MTNGLPEYKFFDPKVLQDIVGNDEEIILEILNEFISSGGSYISDFEKALATADLKEINFLAHKLKGSLRYLGATQLANIAQEIEYMAAHNTGTLNDISALLNELKIDVLIEEVAYYRSNYLAN